MGKQRTAKMKKMRARRMTLQEIGDQFGISRERVRQIIGNTGSRELVRAAEKDRETIQDAIYFRRTMTVDDAAQKYGVARSTVYHIIGSRWKYLADLGLRSCYNCHEIKPLDEFGVNNARKKFKVSGVCRECNNATSKRYYHEHYSKQARAARQNQAA